MAMLRAKQIKLAAQGDLLVGGSSGNGVVLSAGTVGNFLKVSSAGVLSYQQIISSDILHSGTALNTVIENINTKNSDQDILISSIIDSSGFESDGTLVFEETNYLDAEDSLKNALINLDGELATIASDTFSGTTSGIRAFVSTTRSSAINEVATKAVYVNRTANVDPTTSNDSSQGYAKGDIWVNGSEVFLATDVTASNAIWTRIDQNANANIFTYKGTVNASIGANLPVSDLQAGDTWRVTVAGDFETGIGFYLNVGDYLVYNGTDFEKIDNTDSNVVGTSGEITVTGSTDTGFVLSIDDTYIGQASITTLGTITTGTWNGTVIGTSYGGTGLSTVGSQHQVLTVNGSGGLVYAYQTSLRTSAGVEVASADSGKLIAVSATISGDSDNAYVTKGYTEDYVDDAINSIKLTKVDQEEIVGASPGSNYAFDLDQVPVGSISVYFNGLKLNSSGFSVTEDEGVVTITLVDSSNGYAAEQGDVISVVYMYNGPF